MEIDWGEWIRDLDQIQDAAGIDETTISPKVEEWFACADLELCSAFGYYDGPDEVHHIGLGVPAREVDAAIGGRRLGAPDESGLLGHRLTWSARALHTALLWFGPGRVASQPASVNGDHQTTRQRRDGVAAAAAPGLFRSMAARAGAFLREPILGVREVRGEDLGNEVDALRDALVMIANSIIETNGEASQLDLWILRGMSESQAELVRAMEERASAAFTALSARRRRRHTRALRAWARAASTKTSHSATRVNDTPTTYSASPCKSHAGERTAQLAADKGLREWAPHWLATDVDIGSEITGAVQRIAGHGPRAWYVPEDGIQPQIELPVLDAERIDRASRKFKGTTGVGQDHLRLRQISWLSRGTKTALAKILTIIEQHMRWPAAARGTIAVALGKKGGGSRLIGIIVSLYRLWARIRYDDIQEALEARLGRAFLTAAPGEGAARAAAVASLVGEAAWARGGVAATTTADIAKYYEQVTFEEVIHGAIAFGIPVQIIALALHQYAGPRRIRVGQAHSAATYPSRSIIPGCTWATVLIRTIMVAPAEKFIRTARERAEGFDARFLLNVYIDDLAMTTTGSIRDVLFFHSWATKLLVQWVQARLKKSLARDKLVCIASTPTLRSGLTRALNRCGCKVALEGDLLGADYTAGGGYCVGGKG